MSNIKETGLKSLELIIPSQLITKDFRTEIIKLIKEYHTSRRSEGVGKTPVIMKIVEEDKKFTVEYATKFLVSVENSFLAALEKLGVGYKGNVNPQAF